MRRLVVLDVNGILARKSHRKRNWFIHDRMIDFVNSLASKYDIAVWSSTTEKNAKKVINSIRPIKDWSFQWFRDQICIKDPEVDVNDFDTVKNISQIRERLPDLNECKIVIVDDEIKKLRFNQKEEIVAMKIDFDSENPYPELEKAIDEKMLSD